MHYAASWGCNKTMQVLLNICGIKLDLKDAHDMTPLFKAVQIKSFDCVKMLIEAGTNVNITCRNGQSVLEYAIMELGDEGYDIVEYLLKSGGKKKQMADGRRMTLLRKVCLGDYMCPLSAPLDCCLRTGKTSMM